VQNHFHHTIRKMAGWILVALMLLTGFAFTQDKSQALSKDKVITLLRQGTSSVRAQYLVGKYGVDFPFTSDTEQALKRAGADQELLDLIRRVAPPPPVEAKPTPPPPLPVLIVNAKPGDAEVYVDDERHGQTSPDGTLRINGLVAGNHKIRISLPGYKSFEVAIELLAGQTHTVAAMLLPGTPPSAPAEKSPNSIENPSTSTATPPSIEKKPPPDLSDPLTPHEPGIYYLQENGKSRKLVLLDPVPASSPQAKAGRSAAMIGLGVSGKPHWKSTILGGQARVRSPERRPVFYFYFKVAGQDVTGSNIVFQNAAAPTEFILAHLESKKSEREIPNDGANYLGSSTNIRPKNAIAFTNERLAPGIYKVQPQSEMNAGEYGFMYGGSLPGVFMATSTWLFDFGVDKTK
jgi:hypothetical protein